MVAREDVTRRRMSVEQWRDLVAHSDVKYEYHHGWLVAMAGGTFDHATIAINVIEDLRRVLSGQPCRVYNSDMAVRLSPTAYRLPDATVTCDEHDRGRGREVQSPRVIVEVLSETTEAADRTTKFALYRACPSVQEYVVVVTAYQTVEVYRRAEPRWTFESYGPGETVVLESLDARLPVDHLYRLTEVPLPDPISGAHEGRGPSAPAEGLPGTPEGQE